MSLFINALTIFRILAGPLVFILILVYQLFFLGLLVALTASLTDYFDGYLARKYSAVSDFGKIFDPIADKVLVCFSLISITLYLNNAFIGFLTSTVLMREIIVSGLREFASYSSNSNLLAVSFLAKIKTTLQLVTIVSYLVGFSLNNAFLVFISHWIFFLATMVTIKTGYDYYTKLFK